MSGFLAENGEAKRESRENRELSRNCKPPLFRQAEYHWTSNPRRCLMRRRKPGDLPADNYNGNAFASKAIVKMFFKLFFLSLTATDCHCPKRQTNKIQQYNELERRI